MAPAIENTVFYTFMKKKFNKYDIINDIKIHAYPFPYFIVEPVHLGCSAVVFSSREFFRWPFSPIAVSEMHFIDLPLFRARLIRVKRLLNIYRIGDVR